jgi:hypothetical protein
VKTPEARSGVFGFAARLQVRVRILIMKLSNESSATCIQASDSLRYPVRLAYSLLKCGLLFERSA